MQNESDSPNQRFGKLQQSVWRVCGDRVSDWGGYPIGIALGSSTLPERRCDDIVSSHRLSLPFHQGIESGIVAIAADIPAINNRTISLDY